MVCTRNIVQGPINRKLKIPLYNGACTFICILLVHIQNIFACNGKYAVRRSKYIHANFTHMYFLLLASFGFSIWKF